MTQAHELTIVGQPAPRVEGFEKVTGSAQYVADIPAPGALAGKILRSPYAHARGCEPFICRVAAMSQR